MNRPPHRRSCRGRSALPALAAALVVASPGLAAACPNCFGSTEGDVYRMYQYSTVALSLLPFAIVGAVIAAVRRFAREADGEAGPRRRRRGPARVYALPGARPTR